MNSNIAQIMKIDLEFKRDWLKVAESHVSNAKNTSERDTWWGIAQETKSEIHMLNGYLNHFAAVEEEQKEKAVV